ncbi:MAG: hypothetical protein KDD69_15595 [Bdellovibrionales bacterium]|nr:hypothetical protein [Bdellovibrionales bacterium]
MAVSIRIAKESSILLAQKKTVALDWLSLLLEREIDAHKERAVEKYRAPT